MKQVLDNRDDPQLIKARQSVADNVNKLVESIAFLEGVIADMLYERAFNDGVEYTKEEFARLAGVRKEPESDTPKPVKLNEVERIATDHVISCVESMPGLRTSDITSKITALPLRPNVSDQMVWVVLNRLKNENKIENKSGRWYSTKAKARLPDYQVMQYLPDGSKYLGSDIAR